MENLGCYIADEILALCRSFNIIKIVNSIRIRWAGHVARMRGQEMHAEFV
jgi:hypothetical protein